MRVPSAQVFAKLLLFLQSSSRVNNADSGWTAPSEVYGDGLTPLLRLEKLSRFVYRFLGNAYHAFAYLILLFLDTIFAKYLAIFLLLSEESIIN